MPELRIKNISKKFDKTEVIKNVSLDLNDGEFLVLLGPSGCGKSTCLRLVAGLEEVDDGEIYIGTRRVDQLSPKDRNVSMVFQNYSLYPHMTVANNLSFPLKVAGIKRQEIKKRVAETAELIGLGDYLDHKPGQLSGGQRQRVALGRAIIRKPDLFLLDEPLSNLDADLRIRMRREIVRIQKELNCTTVYVTHDQTEALTMGDRIALLDNGKIVQFDTPINLYRKPSNMFTAGFIGTPKINFIETMTGESTLPPFNIAIPREIRDRGMKKIILGIRPDIISINRDGYYKAIVSGCEFVGDSYILSIDFQQHRLLISKQPEFLENGTEIKFTIDTNSILFFDPISRARIA